jgi:hypothetical protein
MVAGGGALIGTGAFTSVSAERDVTVETAGDASALLQLRPADNVLDSGGSEIASITDGTLQITIGGESDAGLNQNAITRFDHVVVVTNNGTQDVESLTVEFTQFPDEISSDNGAGVDETFNFPVAEVDDGEIENGTELAVDGGSTGSPVELLDTDATPDTLSAGGAIAFGLEIDLLNGGNGNNNLPSDQDYTLTIEAEAADSS